MAFLPIVYDLISIAEYVFDAIIIGPKFDQ